MRYFPALLFCVALHAQTITITSPSIGQAVSGFAGAGNLTPPLLTAQVEANATWATLCFLVDGYPVYNPGYGAPFASPTAGGINLAADYANGCMPIHPSNSVITTWSMPWNTFWVAAGSA